MTDGMLAVDVCRWLPHVSGPACYAYGRDHPTQVSCNFQQIAAAGKSAKYLAPTLQDLLCTNKWFEPSTPTLPFPHQNRNNAIQHITQPNCRQVRVVMPCRFKVPIVNRYNQTVGLHFGHITDRPIPGRELDCSHYCSPGVPEVGGTTEMSSHYRSLTICFSAVLGSAPGFPNVRTEEHRLKQAKSGF
jgi:hypothetical protein